MSEQVQSKVCPVCGVEKQAGEFSKNSSKKDGLQGWCKACAAEMRRHQKAGTYVTRLREHEVIVDGEVGRVPVKVKGEIKYALIDSRFAQEVSMYRWSVNSKGYPHGFIDGQKIKLHRYVMILSGALIDNRQVDHISRDVMDARLKNLRAVDQSTNNRNSGTRTGNYRGVNWYKVGEKWHARLAIDGKQKHLGYFSIEQIAARAYDWAVITFFPDDLHAHTNFDRSDYEGFSTRDELLAHYTTLWENEQEALEKSNEDDPFCAADDEDDIWNAQISAIEAPRSDDSPKA